MFLTLTPPMTEVVITLDWIDLLIVANLKCWHSVVQILLEHFKSNELTFCIYFLYLQSRSPNIGVEGKICVSVESYTLSRAHSFKLSDINSRGTILQLQNW